MRLINFKKITSAALTFTLTLNLLFGVIPLTGGVLAQEATPDSVLPETLVEETTAMSVDTISSDPTPSPEPTNSTDSQIQEPVIEKVESPQSEILTTAEIVPTEVTTLVWERLDDLTDRTVQKVAEGVDYRFRDTNVVVRFTKLTAPGYLTIKEVKLSEEQKKNLGALSDTAYDITSDMQNGTFSYDLTLPNPSTGTEVAVKYSEDNENYTKIEVTNKDNVVLLDNLTHFTVFVVTDDDASYAGGSWTDWPNQGYLDTGVHFPNTSPLGQTATWNLGAATPGYYKVYISWSTHSNRTTAASYVLNYSGGSHNFTINQEQLADQLTTGFDGQWSGWFYVGRFNLDASSSLVLTSGDNTSGLEYVIADEVNLESDNPPSVPTLVNPSDGAVIKPSIAILDWGDSTDPEGNTPITYNYRSFWSGGGSYGPVSTGTNSQINATGSSDRVYSWQVQACDSLGNCSDWSGPWQVTIDGTSPVDPSVVSTSHTVSTPSSDNTVDLSVSGATDNLSGVDGFSYLWDTNPSTVPDSTKDIEETTTALTSPVLADGNSHYFHLRTVDNAGNWTATVHVGPFAIDTNPPLAPTPVSPADGAAIQGVAFTQTWTAVADAVLYRYQSCNVDPGDSGGVCSSVRYTNTYTGTSKFVAAGQPDSHFWWRVQAKDAAGNWSNYGEAFEMIIDNTDPLVSWNMPADNDTLIGTIDLSADASDVLSGMKEVKFQYKRNDGLDTFHDIAVVTGPYTSTWDTTSLPLDFYTLRAIATDNAGNESYVDLTVGVAAVITSISSSTPAFGQIEVIWTTDRPTDGRLLYDTANHPAINLLDANYGYANSSGIVDPGKSTSHTVLLSGLNDNTRYYWRVVSAGSPTAISDEYYNNTFSVPGAPPPPGGASGGSVAGVSTVSTLGSTSSYSYGNYGESDGEVLAVENEEEPIEATPAPTLSPEVKGTDVEETWISSYWWVIPVALLVLLLLFVLLRRKRK